MSGSAVYLFRVALSVVFLLFGIYQIMRFFFLQNTKLTVYSTIFFSLDLDHLKINVYLPKKKSISKPDFSIERKSISIIRIMWPNRKSNIDILFDLKSNQTHQFIIHGDKNLDIIWLFDLRCFRRWCSCCCRHFRIFVANRVFYSSTISRERERNREEKKRKKATI